MKDNKQWKDYSIDFFGQKGSRAELRSLVVNAFLKEKGGYWKGDVKWVTRYKYFVETLSDGRKIFLLRPTFLNKGIDFQVWVERLDNGEDKRPSHKDVFSDLTFKKKENPKQFPDLLEAINLVWNCEDPDKVLKNRSFNFKKGYSVELLLKILKWLFIEQDITYWNYDGRGMLLKAIMKERDSL